MAANVLITWTPRLLVITMNAAMTEEELTNIVVGVLWSTNTHTHRDIITHPCIRTISLSFERYMNSNS